jgi:hypothetical protein
MPNARRRMIRKRARYANRYGIRACGAHPGRWVKQGYRDGMTWYYIRKQAN